MIQPGCTKMAIVQLLLAAACSNLLDGKQKCYFIMTCDCFLAIRLNWTELRPDSGTTAKEFVATFHTEKRIRTKILHACFVVSNSTNTILTIL